MRWVGLARGTLDAEQEHAVGKTVLFEGGLSLLAVHVGVDKLRGGFRQVTSFASAHHRVELAGVAWSHRVCAQQCHVSAMQAAKPQGKLRSRRSAARSGARTRGVRRGGAVQGGGGGGAAVEGFVVRVGWVVDGGVVRARAAEQDPVGVVRCEGRGLCGAVEVGRHALRRIVVLVARVVDGGVVVRTTCTDCFTRGTAFFLTL